VLAPRWGQPGHIPQL